jgi:NtrC-family two-component system response regulator AlgB
LRRYPWPGNLRELRNAVERAAILAPGPTVGLGDLPERIGQPGPTAAGAPVTLGGPFRLEDVEVEHLRRVLSTSPSLDAAARTLGIDPSTLYRKRKQHGL